MSRDHQHINEDFLTELFKGCLVSKSILEIVIKHLQYHYIISEAHKKLFQKISQVYELQNTLPTIGSLSQDFSRDENVLKLLQRIRNITLSDNKDILLQTFEKFLVNVKFIDLYQKIGRLNNEGSQDKAIKLLEEEAPVISNFSIKDTYYTTVFKSFEERNLLRQQQIKHQEVNKIPFGIHCLDANLRGGMDRGTSTLIMATSGGGKSTFLRWVAVNAARMGMKVVLFQGEGTEAEALTMLDSAWTSIDTEQMEWGEVPVDKRKVIEKANKDIIAGKGEIYVKASESFDDLTLNDCNDLLTDMEKVHGKFDLVIFDYLEMFSVRGKYFNSESGERKRREDIANKITNIATARNVTTLTAIQAHDVKPELYNNPDFVLTRSNIAEYKGAIKPFSNFITLNMSDDERSNNVMRLFVDKCRKYKSRQVYKVCTSFSNARLYNSSKTLQLFWNETNNQPVKK